MDVAESPELDPRSPEDEEQPALSDDDILRETGSEQDLDGAGERASDLEDEENATRVQSQEETHSDEEDRASEPKSQDQDSEAHELSRGPAGSLCEEGDDVEEDQTSDLRDEASSVTRELDEHELDYDEEVPEEPAPAAQEEEAEKVGAEDEEEKGEGAPGEEGKPDVQSVGEKEPTEAAKEKKKEDDDGEIDDGEIDDDDLEEGEVKDPSDRKVRPRPTCRFFMKGILPVVLIMQLMITNPTNNHKLKSLFISGPNRHMNLLMPTAAVSCWCLHMLAELNLGHWTWGLWPAGNCTWGMNCRFIHPGVNDKGNYSLITKTEPFPPNGAPPLGPHPLMPANPWGAPVVDEILPPPPPEPPTESAWERGLRHAKEVLKKATIRKEQEPDFEEKRFTVTIGEDDREFDKENEVFRDWNSRVPRDVRDTILEPYADPYYDYDIERFWRGGQYENFRVQYTEAEPYHNYRERERERERENRQRERERERERDRERERRQRERERERERERDKERQRRKEEWERERAKRDEKDRQHRDRDRDKDREKDKEKPKPRSPQPPSRQAEPPKKETTSVGPQVKRADEWKDPWRRSKSPKKKLGVSVSPSRARRRRKTSASSASASNSSRSSSRSSSYSGSGSSRSRSRSSSYSSYSSRSSRHSSFSGSRSRSRSFSSSPSPSPTPSPHRPPVRTKGEPAPPPGKAGEKSVKKPAPPPAPPQTTKTTAPAPEPAKPGDLREARRKERQTRTPPRRRTLSGSGSGSGSSYSGSSSRSRSLSVSSVSSVSSATSSSSSVHSVDSEDMYADLASPVSSASSRSPTPAQTKKERGKSKKEDGVREEKRKRDPSTQPPKSSKAPTGGKSSQQSAAPQQTAPGQPQQGSFVAHKEIKLTLLNKAADKGSRKRYEPSDKDRQSPPAKKANLTPDRGSRDRKSGGKMGSPKPERQRGQNAKAPAAQADRKRPLSPQSKSSSKVTSVPGKATDTATAGTKSGKASTLSRREELLKQLKAVEDAIARKRAKIPGKV
ncbi:zinc finger CCCH domain-containing protein 18 isoform X2 [Cricetulus griseus]|uniref:Zinc finger CCCH domain-containing protein 18 isoform X2 n=1 Tax=Cricetulus griseus TaxID=10029 RepID=A0A9J7FQV3_CRIGR|nr:zinc finger CCCH domain-containing protein 18 isoform X2 [Cricetulus griseus]XP_027266471.1 zinc finger CCCH domain-containing protein 18 isoform X2 [Cricetulus griseus]